MHNEDWDKAKRELVKCSRIDVGNTMTLRYMKEVNAALNVDEGVEKMSTRPRKLRMLSNIRAETKPSSSLLP